MYTLEIDKQKELKNFFKLVQKSNKKIDERPNLHNVLVELNDNKVTFNYTNAFFLIRETIETSINFEKNQLFIPDSLIEEFIKSEIMFIDYKDNELIFTLKNHKEVKITQEKITIKNFNSETTMEVKVENYPEINTLTHYFEVTENHYTIQLDTNYLSNLISLGKKVKLKINLIDSDKPIIITSDSGTNAILMPMKFEDMDKVRNQKIQEKLKTLTTADTPAHPATN